MKSAISIFACVALATFGCGYTGEPQESPPPAHAQTPTAASEFLDAPEVKIYPDRVEVNGTFVTRIEAGALANEDALRDALIQKRDAWMRGHTNRTFAGAAIFTVDRDAPAAAVKRAFSAAAAAGYTNVSFGAEKL